MKILLATDGSDCARQAIDFLRRFPIPDNSSVILLTVLVKEFFKGRDKSDLSPEQRDLLHQTKQEMRDEGSRIYRPRQVYTGPTQRDYVKMEWR